MIQLIFHLVGDYVTQSDWMAQNKTKSTWAAFCHATVYSIPFVAIGSWKALFVIWFTHLLIDRFRIARYVVYIKNVALGSPEKGWGTYSWTDCSVTGYPSTSPAWLSVWLLIACDNTMHLAINYASLKFL